MNRTRPHRRSSLALPGSIAVIAAVLLPQLLRAWHEHTAHAHGPVAHARCSHEVDPAGSRNDHPGRHHSPTPDDCPTCLTLALTLKSAAAPTDGPGLILSLASIMGDPAPAATAPAVAPLIPRLTRGPPA